MALISARSGWPPWRSDFAMRAFRPALSARSTLRTLTAFVRSMAGCSGTQPACPRRPGRPAAGAKFEFPALKIALALPYRILSYRISYSYVNRVLPAGGCIALGMTLPVDQAATHPSHVRIENWGIRPDKADRAEPVAATLRVSKHPRQRSREPKIASMRRDNED